MRAKIRSLRFLPLALFAGVSLALTSATGSPDRGRRKPPTPDGKVLYGRDVRPILADRCFRCHGPAENGREAKLRLDERDEAIAARKHGAAIVPGKPEQSLVWQRLTTHDEDERMPPQKSGKPAFSAAEVAIVEQWIAEGAHYEQHWSFAAPRQPQVPTAGYGWARNEIDHFVAAGLAEAGLQPSPAADPATLARRAFLVLTGLPPTPQELDAFLADKNADAYERLVDRLLTEEPYLTRHAEHLAQPWLDAGRYADTSGIHMDAGRQIWPWRDWLLQAIKQDLPFDQVVRDQIAGDLLPNATTAQRVATGFLRSHVTTDEGGAIDEEYRVEYAVERTNTLGSVFLGLTLGCARCHDHKYDPITQQDYYQLYSFFNQNQEPGLYSQSPNPYRALEPALEVPSEQDLAARARLREAIAGAEEDLRTIPADEAQQREVFFAAMQKDGGLQWPVAEVVSATSSNGSTLTAQADGSVLASGANPATDRHVLTLRTEASDLRMLCVEALPDASLPEGKVGRAPNGNAVLESIRLAVRPLGSTADFTPVPFVWASADYEQDDGDYRVVNALRDDELGFAVGAHQRPAQPVRALFLAEAPFGGQGGSELRVELDYDSVYPQHVFGRVRLHVGTLGPAMLDRLPAATSGFYVAGPFPSADGKVLYGGDHGPQSSTEIDGRQRWGKLAWRFDAGLREGTVHTNLPQGRNATFVAQRVYCASPRQQKVSLGSDDGFVLYVGGQKVAERQVDRAASADQDPASFPALAGQNVVVLQVVNTGGQGGFYLRHDAAADALTGDLRLALLPPTTLDDSLRERLGNAWRERFSPDFAARRKHLAGLQQELATLDAAVPQTMVMQEASMQRDTFVLLRGEYDKPDRNRPVSNQIPRMFGELPADAPKNRLGLAQWLTSPGNPLLLRVAQNRLWEFVFGNGIVRTSEDFGLQGEWPSHRELLDWLAVEFRNRGLSTRAMLRLLVTSATFRQDGRVATAAQQKDPQDRLLGWFPRRRLTAETIRDQALYIAGLLKEQQGGPSVKPYQPPGLWKEVAMLQSNTREFQRGMGDDLWRRSLYTYWKRACPPPSLLTLDAPTREFCTVRRSTTNTPLQALVLWNDEQFVEAARVLAQRTLAQAGSDEERLQAAYRRCTGHPLAKEQLQLGLDLLRTMRQRYAAAPDDAKALLAVGEAPRDTNLPAPELAAWTIVANAFLNLDATLCLD
ncbi:MAG: PSD1 domain-containing protein [Planctomycetes bacterium]|nr:PSD1 domain-containing protein [Planctomycetota bacterium]